MDVHARQKSQQTALTLLLLLLLYYCSRIAIKSYCKHGTAPSCSLESSQESHSNIVSRSIVIQWEPHVVHQLSATPRGWSRIRMPSRAPPTRTLGMHTLFSDSPAVRRSTLHFLATTVEEHDKRSNAQQVGTILTASKAPPSCGCRPGFVTRVMLTVGLRSLMRRAETKASRKKCVVVSFSIP